MPPRKAKGKKAAAESKPRRSTRGAKAAESEAEEPVLDAPPQEVDEQPNEALKELLPPTVSDVVGAVKNLLAGPSTPSATRQSTPNDSMLIDESPATETANTTAELIPDVEMQANGAITVVPSAPVRPGSTPEERQAKLEALRNKMVIILSVLFTPFAHRR